MTSPLPSSNLPPTMEPLTTPAVPSGPVPAVPSWPPPSRPAPTQPVSWSGVSAYPVPPKAASGYDRDLKIGTALLIVSLLIVPIVFGGAASYCGFRSHRAGNPAGMPFAIGSIVLTAVNIAIVAAAVFSQLG